MLSLPPLLSVSPLIAAAFFTLLLGIAMIATGLVRIYFAAQLDAPLRRPVLLAGLLTLSIGVIILGSRLDRARIAVARPLIETRNGLLRRHGFRYPDF